MDASAHEGRARELGPRGITINSVQPGPVETEMNSSDSDAGTLPKSLLALSRYARPDEVAAMVAYLASLTIDGGVTA